MRIEHTQHNVQAANGARPPAQRDRSSAEQLVDLGDIFLVGGPAGFPDELRRRRGSADDTTVKIEHYGGHEHFERDDQTIGQSPVIYRWTTRTKIAE
jgi:hypothetical protein